MTNPTMPVVLVGTVAVAAAAIVLYVIAKKGVAGAAAAAVGVAGDAASGAVVGIGQVFGVPATNETECARAKREGRTLDASFHCSAGDFLSWSWSSLIRSEGGTPALTTGDLARADRLAGQAAYTGGATGSW